MDSILLTVKAMLGIEKDYDGFNVQLIAAINNAIFSLSQLGVGPDGGMIITGIEELWATLYDGEANVAAAKSYIYLKCRLEFDPPTSSFVIGSVERQLEQLEFRLLVETESETT